MHKTIIPVFLFITSNATAQTANWEAKFIISSPSGAEDTVWIGCSDYGDIGYQDTLDIIDTEFTGPAAIRAYDDAVESAFDFGTCTNLKKDIKKFASNEEIKFTLYALSTEYPIDNDLFLKWDTTDFFFNEGGYRLSYVYLESQYGYISGIDGHNFTCAYTDIEDGDTIINFINDYTELYPIDTLTNCSDGNWALKITVSVYFNAFWSDVTNSQLNNLISIFPNPVQSELTINNNSEDSRLTITIFKLDGKFVNKTQTINRGANHIANVEHLSAGIYYIHIYNSSHTLLSINKFVKM